MTLFAGCDEGQYLDSSDSCRPCTVCSREKEGIFITVRNEVAKVMLLHLTVILSTGGWGWGWGSASVHAWIPHLPRTRHPPPGTRHPPGPDLPGPGTPRDQIPLGPDPPGPGTPSRTRHPPRGPDPSYQAPPPPREQRWLLLRTVRILLECILVTSIF